MKKFLFVLMIGVIMLSPAITLAEEPTPDPNEVIIDQECLRRILVEPTIMVGDPPHPICNRTCVRSLVESGFYCEWNSETIMGASWEGDDLNFPLTPGPVDAAYIYIRAALYAVMGAIAIAVVLYGLYGWYQHAMSEGKPDKLELVRKIYTNAIIGAVIVLSSFLVVQILSTFLGVTESLFEMDFIPKSGYEVEVRSKDVGRVCFENQKDASDEDGYYSCLDGKWVSGHEGDEEVDPDDGRL